MLDTAGTQDGPLGTEGHSFFLCPRSKKKCSFVHAKKKYDDDD